MNRKLLTIAIALMIFAMAVGPVAATLPPTNPLPKGTGWNSVWQLLQDLQDQITALTTRVNSIESNPVHFGGWWYGPTGPGPGLDPHYQLYTHYTAPTDGFVVARAGEGCIDDPRTIHFYVDTWNEEIGGVGQQGVIHQFLDEVSFTMPVRAGDKWRITTSPILDGTEYYQCIGYEIYWIPLTS